MTPPSPRGTPLVFVLFVLLAWGASACTVDGSFLDATLFECTTSQECGAGWGCLRGSPYAVDFCASECDASCDGVCVMQEGTALCLRGCRIREDGTSSACPGEGYSCIRVSAQHDDGVCYPARSCTVKDDCAEGQDCFSDLAARFGISGALRTDNLYCLPAPSDADNCPPRSAHSRRYFSGSVPDVCVPLCDASDTRCPPGFGCLRQLAGTREAVCLPGIYGVPCDDDTNCLLGTCRDTGPAGRFCTTTCDDAESTAFGCERISLSLTLLGLRYHLECDPAAGGGASGGLCVPRYEIGAPCTTPESGVYACAAGLTCRDLPGSDGIKECTHDCDRDEDCDDDGLGHNYCNFFFSVCMARQPAGEGCVRVEECASGRCVDGTCG